MVVLVVGPVEAFFIAGFYIVILATQPMAIYNFFSALNASWQTVPVLIAIAFTDGFVVFNNFASITIIGHIVFLFFQKCIEEMQNMVKIIGSR